MEKSKEKSRIENKEMDIYLKNKSKNILEHLKRLNFLWTQKQMKDDFILSHIQMKN
uniref:Uncharacterized protein n=1 Tax=Sarcophilus harrisii TaxID=9305 RepID=A0A7N4V158_SARHA